MLKRFRKRLGIKRINQHKRTIILRYCPYKNFSLAKAVRYTACVTDKHLMLDIYSAQRPLIYATVKGFSLSILFLPAT